MTTEVWCHSRTDCDPLISTHSVWPASATFCEKAQVCLDEYFRVMETYVGTLPKDRLADHDALKGLGLQQVLQIYKLLFGGHVMTTGTRGGSRFWVLRTLDSRNVLAAIFCHGVDFVS